MSGDLPPGTPEAEHLARELAPVWDASGRRWTYVADAGAYLCDDPTYPGPGATSVGAIPDQPTYGHPPAGAVMYEPDARSTSRKWRVHLRGETTPESVDGAPDGVGGVAVFRVLNGRELVKLTAFPLDTIAKIETQRP